MVALNLLVAVQECLVLASHWLADEGLDVPESYRDVMRCLAGRSVITPELAGRLGEAAGLQNVIAHQYAKMDWARVYEAASGRLGDLEAFCDQIARAAGA